MPNPTVFDEDFADVIFLRFHNCFYKSKVSIFFISDKLTGRTGSFNDQIEFYRVRQGFSLSNFKNIVSGLRLFFWRLLMPNFESLTH